MRTLRDSSFYLEGLSALSSSCGQFEAVLKNHGTPPLWERPNNFRSLVHIILEQQVSLASAKATLLRLESCYSLVSIDAVLRAGEEGVRQQGVTRQKSAYIVNVAKAIKLGELDLLHLESLSDQEVIAMLTKIKGIGLWTANIYLLMVLLRPDVWPKGDLALANAMNKLFGVTVKSTDSDFIEMAEAWRPWRAVAARLLWNYYLSDAY